MKEDNTVLILGAGASKPYGFPIGTELLEKIKVSLTGHNDFRLKLREEKYLDSDMEKLLGLLKRTQVDTIDEFLGSPVCKNSVMYTKMIKYAIAYILLRNENDRQLETPNDWYKKLYVRIFGLLEDNFTNNTTVVTFNYDRSLEEFLYRTHAAKQGILLDDARNSPLFKKNPIIHVHGKLSSSGYGGYDNFKTIDKASRGIIVNTDLVKQNSSNEIRKANKAIQKANSVYILGFGYNDENIKKIGLNLFNPRINIIKGTAMNISTPFANHIREMIPGIVLVDSDSNQFLTDEWR